MIGEEMSYYFKKCDCEGKKIRSEVEESRKLRRLCLTGETTYEEATG